MTIDEDILRGEGITNFEKYSFKPGNEIYPDFFVPDNYKFHLPKKSVDISLKSEDFTCSKVFEEIEQGMLAMSEPKKRELIGKVKAVFDFVIKNQKGETKVWSIDLKENFTVKNEKSAKPEIVLRLDDADFVKIALGQLSGQRAFMTGKLKVKGNFVLATKLDLVMKAVKSQKSKL